MAKQLNAPKGRGTGQWLTTKPEYGQRSFIVDRIEPLVACTPWLRRPYVYEFMYYGHENHRPSQVAWLESMIDWTKAGD